MECNFQCHENLFMELNKYTSTNKLRRALPCNNEAEKLKSKVKYQNQNFHTPLFQRRNSPNGQNSKGTGARKLTGAEIMPQKRYLIGMKKSAQNFVGRKNVASKSST